MPATDALATWPALLRESGTLLGLDTNPDEEGYLALVVDAACTVQIQCTEDGRQATLFVALGHLDGESLARIAPQLLAANFFWQGTGGATLGHDPLSGEMVLARAYAIEPFLVEGSTRAAHRFVDELRAFADRALAWQAALPEWLEMGVGAAAAVPPVLAPGAGLMFDRA